MTNRLCTAVRLSTLAITVAVSLIAHSSRAQIVNKPCDESSFVLSRVQLENGSFPLDFMDAKHPLGKKRFLDSQFDAVSYETTNQIVRIPEISTSSCKNVSRLSTVYFKAERVVGLQLRGRTFAYVVFAQLRTGEHGGAIGAVMNIVFYDLDGKGVFNAVETGLPYGLPFIPSWVK
jgi:hypothetical protein